jgi:hypothetical protein
MVGWVLVLASIALIVVLQSLAFLGLQLLAHHNGHPPPPPAFLVAAVIVPMIVVAVAGRTALVFLRARRALLRLQSAGRLQASTLAAALPLCIGNRPVEPTVSSVARHVDVLRSELAVRIWAGIFALPFLLVLGPSVLLEVALQAIA